MEKTPHDLINELIDKYPSLRNFARTIREDASDVIRWRYAKAKIHARAVISICRLHPEIIPYQLDSATFPEDLTLKFGETNGIAS